MAKDYSMVKRGMIFYYHLPLRNGSENKFAVQKIKVGNREIDDHKQYGIRPWIAYQTRNVINIAQPVQSYHVQKQIQNQNSQHMSILIFEVYETQFCVRCRKLLTQQN